MGPQSLDSAEISTQIRAADFNLWPQQWLSLDSVRYWPILVKNSESRGQKISAKSGFNRNSIQFPLSDQSRGARP
jgi:hypothetical protein